MANSYVFFAIAPYESTPAPALTVDATSDNIQIGNTNAKYDISTEYNLARTAFSPSISETEAPKNTLTYSGFKKDYMLAAKSTATSSDVNMVFKHILAKLNVKIVKSATYNGMQELKINELKIAGLAKEGYYVYNTNFTTKGWTTNDTYARDIATDYSLTAATNYNNCFWLETLIFPQTIQCKAIEASSTATALTDMYLYIKYQIGSETYDPRPARKNGDSAEARKEAWNRPRPARHESWSLSEPFCGGNPRRRSSRNRESAGRPP